MSATHLIAVSDGASVEDGGLSKKLGSPFLFAEEFPFRAKSARQEYAEGEERSTDVQAI